MNYKVKSQINDDIEYFNSKKEVKEYIKSELKWANVNEKQSPYTVDDFIITDLETSEGLGITMAQKYRLDSLTRMQKLEDEEGEEVNEVEIERDGNIISVKISVGDEVRYKGHKGKVLKNEYDGARVNFPTIGESGMTMHFYYEDFYSKEGYYQAVD